MKANEVPERIWINSPQDLPCGFVDKNSIEYIRTDAFIEKACEWIKEFNNHHYIIRYSDSCEPPLSEVTEWFINYMKGE